MKNLARCCKSMSVAQLRQLRKEIIENKHGLWSVVGRSERLAMIENELQLKMSRQKLQYFTSLYAANLARDVEWTGNKPGLLDASFRGNETAGEIGEAIEAVLDTLGYTAALAAAGGRVSNLIKKLERERLGIAGSRATVDQVKLELGDVVICAHLVAMQYGFDLEPEVIAKFNATSEKMGLSTRLKAPGQEALTHHDAWLLAKQICDYTDNNLSQFDACDMPSEKALDLHNLATALRDHLAPEAEQAVAAKDYCDGRFYAPEAEQDDNAERIAWFNAVNS